MMKTKRGQSVLEYAVLVASVSVAVVLAARYISQAFTTHAQKIEEENIVF